MSDIAQRLRSCQGRDFWPPDADRICAEAADEIDRLRADNEQLRKITEHQSDLCIERLDEITRLRKGNAELLAALKQIDRRGGLQAGIARAAIAKATPAERD